MPLTYSMPDLTYAQQMVRIEAIYFCFTPLNSGRMVLPE